MAKQYIVERNIDDLKETIELVFRIVNGKSYEQLKIDMLKRLDQKEHKSISKLLDQLSKIEKDMRRYIDVENKKIQFYFKEFLGEELCVAKLLYQGVSYIKVQSDIEQKKKALAKYIKRMMEDNSLELSLAKNELTASPYEDGSEHPFLERIDHLECDSARKWELLYLLKNVEDYIEDLFRVLEPLSKRLMKHKTVLETLLNNCCDYWEEYFKTERLLLLINKFYGLEENSYKEMTAYIRPQIMDCDHVIFVGNDETMGDYHILEVGITFDKDFNAAKKRPTNEQICNGLKILSDPSKFEILKRINGKKAYGQELAQKTNLTTATISHHMNTLMSFGFITIEKADNKVFYSMNQKAIREFLMTTVEVLVEEETNEV
ncbi:MAG: ArsR family transcriptional regulator [bacterium]|nr:ArsR family transcriptional regulator [bacterium]